MRGNGGFTYDDKVRNILNLNRVIGMVSSHIIVIHNKESPCVNNGNLSQTSVGKERW